MSVLRAIDLDDLPSSASYERMPPSVQFERLGRGTWLEYRRSAGKPLFVKVAWINERRSVALLVRHPDRRAVSRPMPEIRRMLESGRLRVLRRAEAA